MPRKKKNPKQKVNNLSEKPEKENEGIEVIDYQKEMESLQDRVDTLEREKENQIRSWQQRYQQDIQREKSQNDFLMDTIRTFNSLSRKIDELLMRLDQFVQEQQRQQQHKH